jgi:choice-of-anchor A domain-containing protein
MRWAWWGCVVCAVVAATGAVATSAREPTTARSAQTTCADLSPASEFNTFVEGDHRIDNNDVYGRMAVGGNAEFGYQESSGDVHIGNALTNNPARVDLIVGGNIVVTSGSVNVNSGSATYGGQLTSVSPKAGSSGTNPRPSASATRSRTCATCRTRGRTFRTSSSHRSTLRGSASPAPTTG